MSAVERAEPPTGQPGRVDGQAVVQRDALVGLRSATGADLGEASGVNDASSRVGGVIVVALVPGLIGAGAGRSFTQSLADGFQPTMIVMGFICVAAALITAVFVTNGRPSSPRVVPHAADHSCAFPISDPTTP